MTDTDATQDVYATAVADLDVVPRDDSELVAIAIALDHHRAAARHAGAFSSLSLFEGALADRVARHVRDAIIRELERAIGRAATTLDAARVRAAIANVGLDVDFRPPPPADNAGYVPDEAKRRRAAELVVAVLEGLELSADADAAGARALELVPDDAKLKPLERVTIPDQRAALSRAMRDGTVRLRMRAERAAGEELERRGLGTLERSEEPGVAWTFTVRDDLRLA